MKPGRRSGLSPAAATKPVPKQLPVDMRLPCTDMQSCKKNVDVVRQPDPPTALDISSCTVNLMPWSAFPCAFDADQYAGLPGQASDLCYTNNSEVDAALGPSALARNLTTDGYNNLFYGVLPQQLCHGIEVPQVESLLLNVDFRLATGRQFDRTYSFQIGHAVAAFGTCSEPSRLINADKTWSTRVDVSHLQPYMQPGMPTRFSLSNVLSNTYNVPIWARITLDVYYKIPTPSTTSSTHVGASHVVRRALQVPELPESAALTRYPLSMSSVQLVPDEVIPLVPFGKSDMEALSVIGGDGDRPAHWPNVTFELPTTMSVAGDIYRTQLHVVPKGNGCEEFWAMNPSGASTNSTCGEYSTGEPYREVRVYVDGQLAGFYPISYTMYTGGVDPRLWTAIVASNTYSLPVYVYDLSPWLGVLNNNASNSNNHTITVELFGASGNDWGA
ncbi:hypothetical protein OEZ85_014473 [Tetradesmus obliquus]|uniref:Peptide N-acetyl-beta-D-glucosaminyl asparaginase amidase A N-terminal domain-containing protein n=1 Tax=Tetradesmus obliquus TaxID=3088 RepID=A0ABY8U8M3_TETOB|nr:hypothetical protein OEZ85_014473 [Tetradesmus obliquus]